MQFTLKALFDDETRKEIREAVLGEARAMARNLLDQEFANELKRVVQHLKERYEKNDWMMKGMVRDVIKEIITLNYDEIKQKILADVEVVVEDAANREVQKKLKSKTVWEASAQETYIRKLVRKELVEVLAGVKGSKD